ncbi:DNA-binding transcriptional regulator YhcF (GntR family) [Rathayibacter sp. PhB152]|uniref:GntR family transcriptional regulator n=1 Tax=unclassified Rathayibacter TaxID=2609250 RepID=UPI000F4C72B3|nr:MULTISPECIES: GntR family transcriptional regulator [unclassified Rathayibacter]ROQ63970.1 DNA-binding transcriptional regulator YhcF (GntR family) [Rathayibacter sp. PhB152]ROS29404.1 DNA-binding transcriptional regulator YhcF (GntR family) [Rathayibacter sp. PhB127]
MTAAGLGLRLEPGPRAPFEQIREGITAQIAAGSLLVGTRLPAVRTLAEELGVAPGTVARAYKELEAAGIVETRGRAGTVVSGGVDSVEHELQLAAGAYAARVRALGATPERALEVAAAALGTSG